MSKIFIPYYNESKPYIEEVSLALGKENEFKSSSLESAEKTSEKNIDYMYDDIDWSDIVIIMIFPGLEELVCINKVIAYAERSGKQILGIYLHDSQNSNLPQGMKDFGQSCVTMDDDSAIKKIIDDPDAGIWQDSDGSPLAPGVIERFTC